MWRNVKPTPFSWKEEGNQRKNCGDVWENNVMNGTDGNENGLEWVYINTSIGKVCGTHIIIACELKIEKVYADRHHNHHHQ